MHLNSVHSVSSQTLRFVHIAAYSVPQHFISNPNVISSKSLKPHSFQVFTKKMCLLLRKEKSKCRPVLKLYSPIVLLSFTILFLNFGLSSGNYEDSSSVLPAIQGQGQEEGLISFITSKLMKLVGNGLLTQNPSSTTGAPDLNHENILTPTGSPSFSSKDELRREIKRRLAAYKSEVEFVHDLGGDAEDDDSIKTSKIKRAVIAADNFFPGRKRRNITHNFAAGGSQVVTRIFRRQPQPFDAKVLIDFKVSKFKENTYVFTLEKIGAETDIVVYKIEKELNPKEIIRQASPGATNVIGYTLSSQYHILVRTYNEEAKPSIPDLQLYRVEFSNNKLVSVQTIKTPFVRTIKFWTGSGEEANDVFLAVAPEFKRSPNGIISKEVDVSIYRWQGGYYDLHSTIPAKNPQALSHGTLFANDYLATANYQDDAKSLSVYSQIFKYNHKESSYLLLQQILTHGAKDIQFFNINAGVRDEYFLAIANSGTIDEQGRVNHQVKSHILKFARERFFPFQSFDTFGCYQILPVKEVHNQYLLLVAEMTGFRVLQYNGWKFVQTHSFRLGEGDIQLNSIKLTSFEFEKQPYIGIASQEKEVEGGIYAIAFDQKAHNKLSDDVEKWCLTKLAVMESVNTSELVEKSDEAPKLTDQEVVLSSPLSFDHGVQIDELFSKKLIYSDKVFDAQLSKTLAGFEAQLRSLKEAVLATSVRLSQVVTRDTAQLITSPITFEQIEFSGSSLKTIHVSTDDINGIRVNELKDKAIRLDKDYKFETATIEEVVANGDTEILKLNGNSLESYALKSSPQPQTFTAKNTFEAEVTASKGFKVLGLVDDVDVHRVDFLIQGNQTFRTMNIKDSKAEDLIAEIVNGIHLKDFMDDAVLKTGDETIKGVKEFSVANAKHFKSQVLHGIVADYLFANAILLRAPFQEFTGRRTLIEQLIANSVQITTGLMNDKIKIESDMVSISSGTYHLDSIELSTDTDVKDLTVKTSLNQIEVKDGKLDLIHKSSSATQLVANKILDAIKLEKDSRALGLVDNIQLEGWTPDLEIELQDNHITLGRLTTEGSLKVMGGIHIDPSSGKFKHGSNDVAHLLRHALRLNQDRIPDNFKGKLIFESIEVEGDTKVHQTLNDMKTTQWLLRNPSPSDEVEKITAKKTFTNLELLESSTTEALFASKAPSSPDLLKIFNDLLIDGFDQTVLKNSEFTDLLEIENLDCPALELNGISFKDLMLRSGDREMEGTQTFKKEIKVNNVFKIDGDMDVHMVNGQDLNAALLNTLRTSSPTPQILSGKASFENKLEVENLIVDGKIGGEDAAKLLGSIIRNDLTGQTIKGSLTFAGPADLDNLNFDGLINGIPKEEFTHGWLMLTGEQLITTHTTFKTSLKADNIFVVNGKVSNFDLMKFSEEVQRIDKDGSFGVMFFEGTITAGNGVPLGPKGTVNGFDLKKDILRKDVSTKQIVTGKKVFQDVVRMNRNLEIQNLMGFPYDEAARYALRRTDSSENLHVKGNVGLQTEPSFDSFQNVPWDEVIADVWCVDQDRTISAEMEFSRVVLENGAKLTGLLNKVNIVELSRDYLSKSKDQTITGGPITFDRDVSFDSLSVRSIEIQNGGKVNNVDLEKFKNSIFLHGVDQDINKKMSFEKLQFNDIILEDKVQVGKLDLNQDAMTLHGDNVFKRAGDVTFESLQVDELTLSPSTKLNEIDLDEWFKASAMLNADATSIRGSVSFKSAEFKNGVVVRGKVNGITYTTSNIFTLSDDQFIDGLFTFAQEEGNTVGAFLAPEGFNVEGKFNDVDLVEAIKPLVKDETAGLGGPLTVTGKKKFNQELHAETVHAEGLFQENDLDAIIRDLEARSHFAPEEFDTSISLEAKYKELADSAVELRAIAARKAVFFESFTWINVIHLTSLQKLRTLDILDSHRIVLVVATDLGKQIAIWGEYNEETNTYQPSSFMNFDVDGEIQDIIAFQHNTDNFLFITIRSTGAPADISSSNINTKSVESEIEKSEKLSRALLVRVSHPEQQVVPPVSVVQTIFGDDFGGAVNFVLVGSDESIRDCVGTIIKNVGKSRAQVLCFSSSKQIILNVVQSLPTENPSLISAMVVREQKTLLLVASNNMIEKTGAVDIWGHSKGAKVFSKEDCIPTINLVSMDVCFGFNNKAFLALASGNIKNSLNFGRVNILRYSHSTMKFIKQQSIAVEDPLQVQFLPLPEAKELHLYILKNSNQRNILVYAFKGKFGWSLEHTITVEKGTQLQGVTYLVNQNFRAQLLVRVPGKVNFFSLDFNGISELSLLGSKSNSSLITQTFESML